MVLYAPTQDSSTWPRWQTSPLSKQPLLLRIAKSLGNLMHDPRCTDVKVCAPPPTRAPTPMHAPPPTCAPPPTRAPQAPPASATPSGVYSAALDTLQLENSLLASGLAGKEVLFSAEIEDGRDAEGPFSFPRIFDLYAVMSESTNTLKTVYVCVGYAIPLDMKTHSAVTTKALALGIEVAVIAAGRAATAERTVEFRMKGRAIDPLKVTQGAPAHPLLSHTPPPLAHTPSSDHL